MTLSDSNKRQADNRLSPACGCYCCCTNYCLLAVASLAHVYTCARIQINEQIQFVTFWLLDVLQLIKNIIRTSRTLYLFPFKTPRVRKHDMRNGHRHTNTINKVLFLDVSNYILFVAYKLFLFFFETFLFSLFRTLLYCASTFSLPGFLRSRWAGCK